MNNKIKLFLLLLTITFSSIVSAQINFKKGYIITNDNDTISGWINDGGANRNSTICIFKKNRKDKKVKYHPGEIKSFRMINDKYYTSKEIEVKDAPRVVFLEVVVEGKVNLYHYWQDKTMAYYLEKDNRLIGLFNEVGLIRPNSSEGTVLGYGPEFVVRNREYLDSLIAAFKDSKKIVDRIDEVQYKETELAGITKDYILENCKSNHCINYERDHKIYKPTMGVFSGVRLNQLSFYSNYYTYTEKASAFTSYPIGVFFNFPIHSLTDKLSFQLEIVANSMETQQDFRDSKGFLANTQFTIKNSTIGLPLLLKYEIGNQKLRPTIGVGKEIGYGYKSDVIINEETNFKVHSTQKGNWFGQAGLTYKIANRFSVFADLRVQRNENLIIEDRYQSSSYKVLVEKETFKRKFSNLSSAILIGLEF